MGTLQRRASIDNQSSISQGRLPFFLAGVGTSIRQQASTRTAWRLVFAISLVCLHAYGAKVDVTRLDNPRGLEYAALSSVADFQITPDGVNAIFLGDFDTNDFNELYCVPVDGSAAPRKLNAALVSGWHVGGFKVSPDGRRVVYAVDSTASYYPHPSRTEALYSVSLDGASAPVRLTDAAAIGTFVISPDSRYVVFGSNQGTYCPEAFLPYSVPIDGGSDPVLLDSQEMKYAVFSPDSQQLVYVGYTLNIGFRVCIVPVAGGTEAKALSAPFLHDDFEPVFTPDGQRVVYLADRNDYFYPVELYSVSSSGDSAPVKLCDTLALGGDVDAFVLSPDGTHVAYKADQDVYGLCELYITPVDGSTPPVKLSAATFAQGDIGTFSFAPDGAYVVYTSQQDTVNLWELYSVPAAGGTVPVKLSTATAAKGGVADFLVAPGSQRVVYRENQDSEDGCGAYSVPIEGGAPIKLNGSFTSGEEVSSIVMAPDGKRVAFQTAYFLEAGGISTVGLYSVPVDGSEAAVTLDGPLFDGALLYSFAFTPDSQSIVYNADREASGNLDLYRVPAAAATPPVQLDVNVLRTSAYVSQFRVSPDEQTVAYRMYAVAFNTSIVYSAAVDGATAPRELGRKCGLGQFMQISPDGRLFYDTDCYFDADMNDVYVVPLDGSEDSRFLCGSQPHVLSLNGATMACVMTEHYACTCYEVLRSDQNTDYWDTVCGCGVSGVSLYGIATAAPSANVPLFSTSAIDTVSASPDGQWVVFQAGGLYAVPADGSAVARLLAENMTSSSFVITPDSTRIVYRADDQQLYSAALDGSAAATPLDAGVQAGEFSITADSQWVLFGAVQAYGEIEGVYDLYSVAVDGTACPILLAAGVSSAIASPDSQWAAYRAGDQLLGVPINGCAPPVVLSEGGVPGQYSFTPDSAHLAYVANTGVADELFAVSLAGRETSVKLNGALNDGENVTAFTINSTSRAVAFNLALPGGRTDLYSVAMDGSALTKRSSDATSVEGEAMWAGGRLIYRDSLAKEDGGGLYISTVSDGVAVQPEGAFETSGNVGGPFAPAHAEYTLTNQSSLPVQYLVAVSSHRIGFQVSGGEELVDSVSGTLEPFAIATIGVYLNGGVVDTLAGGTYEDTLVFTDSASGERLAVRDVRLTVAALMPDLVGMAQNAGESALASANLGVGEIREQQSDTVPAGQIIEQDPAPGTPVAAGARATIIVSTGPAAGAVKVAVGPADVVALGAQWRVDGGAWQDTDATVSGLSTGEHLIEFKEVQANTAFGCVASREWSTPEGQTIIVTAGETTQISGEYEGSNR